jgi:hypothetical protein
MGRKSQGSKIGKNSALGRALVKNRQQTKKIKVGNKLTEGVC